MNLLGRHERGVYSTSHDALVIGGTSARCDRSISMPPERSALNPQDGHRHIKPSSGPTDDDTCSGVPHVGQSASKIESRFDGLVSMNRLLPTSAELQSSSTRPASPMRGRT